MKGLSHILPVMAGNHWKNPVGRDDLLGVQKYRLSPQISLRVSASQDTIGYKTKKQLTD